MNAVVRCKPWVGDRPPKKILVMRFQALGDTVITLPYLKSIKQQYPDIVIHFLTRKEVSPVPASILLFDRVITIGGGRNAKLQFVLTLFKLPWLWFQRYDAVLDLQNHKISKAVRKLMATAAWTEFDRSSPISAGERTRQTIEALWTWKITLVTLFQFKDNKFQIDELLNRHGWKRDHELVVLNPAGYSPSRSWPINHYIEFAKAWIEYHESTQFVLL
ncbi:MAG TPA: hypothetical protein VL443_08770, partial [Cyclobacteriaceae bacterium]|nr:hypothetical protein [Cyclobacteriaceae bacterium]